VGACGAFGVGCEEEDWRWKEEARNFLIGDCGAGLL